MTTIAENVPTITFLGILHATGDLRTAGWLGAAASAITLGFFMFRRLACHPILLAINLYILLITPTIETLYLLDLKPQGDFIIAHTQVGVLLAVLVTGVLLTVMSKKGFIGVECVEPAQTRKLSFYLIAASSLAVIWSAAFEGDRLFAIALPLAGLFGFRQYLIAVQKDRSDNGDLTSIAAMTAASSVATSTQEHGDLLA